MPRYFVEAEDTYGRIDYSIAIYGSDEEMEELLCADMEDINLTLHSSVKMDNHTEGYDLKFSLYGIDYERGERGVKVHPYPHEFVEILEKDGIKVPAGLIPSDPSPKTTNVGSRNTPDKTTTSATLLGKNEMNINKLRDTMFREVTTVVLDGITGKPAIKTENGLVSVDFDSEGNHNISINPLTEMGMELPAFAMPITLDKIERGDIYVAANGSASFVSGVEEDKIRVVTPNGTNSKITPATNILFGTKTVLIVKNMLGAMNGGGSGFNPMMLALMSKDSGGSDDMMKIVMMSQMMGGNSPNAGMNPMMLALMLKK